MTAEKIYAAFDEGSQHKTSIGFRFAPRIRDLETNEGTCKLNSVRS